MKVKGEGEGGVQEFGGVCAASVVTKIIIEKISTREQVTKSTKDKTMQQTETKGILSVSCFTCETSHEVSNQSEKDSNVRRRVPRHRRIGNLHKQHKLVSGQ